MNPTKHRNRPEPLARWSWAPLLAAGVALLLASAPAAAEDEWQVYWKNGTRIESADGEFKLKLGGRIQADFSSASGDDAIDRQFDLEGGSEFRRARLFFEGTIYQRFEFKAQYDFTGSATTVKDLWIGIKDLPVVGGVRIGHQKEPFGMEQLTSSKYLAFLERSTTDEALNEGRNTGVMLHNQLRDERITWAAGMFRPTDNSGASEDDVWNLTARVTGLPVYHDEGRKLVHVGVGFSDRSPANKQLRIRSRPEAHLAPRFVDTGSFASDQATVLNLELATVQGPLWAAAEISRASVAPLTGTPVGASPGPDLEFSGFNIQVGYYLTGEHRVYKKSSGAWDRLKPKSDFVKGGGSGAWEIAARYSSLELTDRAVAGGELDNFTLALNWYPNSAVRTMLNYVRSELQNIGDADFVLLRFQVDF